MPTRPLDVLVDGRALTGLGHLGGIGSYTRSMLSALADHDDLALSVVTTAGASVPDGVRTIRTRRVFSDRRPSMYEHELRLPFDVARRRSDLFWCPEVPGIAWTGKPYVQTLHDVIPLVTEHEDIARMRKWWKRFGARYRRADLVVADSRHSADEGIRLLGLDPKRVEVVHLGVNGAAFSPGTPDEEPYLLVVGEYQQRKGWPEAFALLAALHDRAEHRHVRLKVAGRVRPGYLPEVEAARDATGASGIELLGFVDDLPALYRGASVYTCTSRYEGFGLPLLEAMASGVPVVTFDNSCLPEVVGDAGIVVPDGDIQAMAAEVHSLLSEPSRWRELRDAGLERARQFTWSGAADRYSELFRSVL